MSGIVKKFQSLLVDTVRERVEQEFAASQVSQRLIQMHYRQLVANGLALPKFEETGFRVFSQNDEDGLLLYIFSLIGITNKVCAELAFGAPMGANSTNLICNWGWSGLLADADRHHVAKARCFFESHRDTWIFPPKIIEAWITAENVNDLFVQNEITGAIDLFSLDIDGMDYWVWKALTVVTPRVVVVEFQDFWGPEKAVTVPYDREFKRDPDCPDYFGASLAAFVKLAKSKGYRLVGCNRYGFNAFFIKDGIGEKHFPEVSPHACLSHPKVGHGERHRLPKVKHREWLDV